MLELSRFRTIGKVGGQNLGGTHNREQRRGQLADSPPRSEHRGWLIGQPVPNYLGVSPRFASSCTDFVVADLSIVDLVGRRHATGGFVICFANTR